MPNDVLPDFSLPQWNWYDYLALSVDILMLVCYLIWRIIQKIAKKN